jgi:hypothetical protein
MPDAPRRQSYVPPQHGAWAFVAVPLVLGWTVTSWHWVLVPFSVAWVAAYPASYFALQVAYGRVRVRPVRQLAAWAAVVAGCGMVTLALRPWLLWAGLVWAGFFAVTAAFARRRADRAFGNDLVLVGQSASVIPVVSLLGLAGFAGLAPPPPTDVPATAWVLTAASALWFTGSVLHVKSLIRERRNARWMWASRIYHLAVLPVALWLSPWLLLPFGFSAARAWAVTPDRGLRPAAIGGLELVGSLLLVAAGWLA